MKQLINLFLLLVLLTSCVLPSTLPSVTDLTPAASNIVVIGKFELSPPLEPELEQATHWNLIGDRRILNKVVVATGKEFKPVSTSSIKLRDWKNSIEAEWGAPFMIEVPRQRTWLRGAMTQLDLVNQDRLWFPGGVYFDVPSGAEAIYIGTLHYVRDDFNNIVDMQIRDEFDFAVAELGLESKREKIVTSLLAAPK